MDRLEEGIIYSGVILGFKCLKLFTVANDIIDIIVLSSNMSKWKTKYGDPVKLRREFSKETLFR